MDPFSQAALGAVVGQAAGHRTLGHRAALWGGVLGALPDVDVLFSLGGDFVDQLVTHRGITHSLLFVLVAGPALGWLLWRCIGQRAAGPPGEARSAWLRVAILALLSHPLLDLLTPFGTQLLLPFSDARFAINAMPIIDPAYTLLLAAGLLLAWRCGQRWPAGATALATLLVSSAYLGYGWLQSHRAAEAAAAQLHARGVTFQQLAAFPTIFQVHMRRVVARSPDVDRVGFYSTWSPCEIVWHEAPRLPADAYQPLLATREGRVFQWFTMGWVHYARVMSPGGPLLVAGDLRYGYDDDPLASVFTLTAPLDAAGTPTGPILVGRNNPDDMPGALERLFRETYAPACRLFSGGRLDHNAAEPSHP